MIRERTAFPILFLILLTLLTGCVSNPHLMEAEPQTGYEIYRTGRLTKAEFAALCQQGVRQMVVMDGSADRRECAWRDELCPEMVVRYDQEQDVEDPLSEDFLAAFEGWVREAKLEGEKIAFRCFQGYHRAGRIGAWYRMRFQNLPPDAAWALLEHYGRFLWLHPQLEPQVEALWDHVHDRPCSTEARFCVRRGAVDPGLPAGEQGFFRDVCGGEPSAR